MNNNAFKDLVRSYNDKKASSSSSKVVARRAVEEEFRKKKKKRKRSGGDDYSSSSDEDGDDRASSKRKNKRQDEKGNNEASGGDNEDAIRKDLSSRYRDRAKERREGKPANDGDTHHETTSAVESSSSSNNFLIVPHSIKGLDLTLARKERKKLRSRSAGGHEKHKAATNTDAQDRAGQGERTDSDIRSEMPTMSLAKQILQDFVCSTNKNRNNDGSDDDGNGSSVISDTGLVEYLSEIVDWKTLDVTNWEGKVDARNSLRDTKFSFAIDGNPSDPTRAWQIPRQYTLSRGCRTGGGTASSALLPVGVMNQIEGVFLRRNAIRKDMMTKQKSTVKSKDEKSVTPNNYCNDYFDEESDEDDSDDNMFGGLDD